MILSYNLKLGDQSHFSIHFCMKEHYLNSNFVQGGMKVIKDAYEKKHIKKNLMFFVSKLTDRH